MSATEGLFRKYLKRIFIETGSNYGDGVQQAIDDGFETIYSIEIDEERYEHCINRFKGNRKVHIILGDTVRILPVLLKLIDEPVTFWLDAHKGNGKAPLMQELDIIKNHAIKNHTILIDDLRDWDLKKAGFNTDVLKQKALEINDNYKFSLEDGYVPDDILAIYE